MKTLRDELRDYERYYLITTLNGCKKNYAAAAQVLGISRSTLYRKVAKFGIQRQEPDQTVAA